MTDYRILVMMFEDVFAAAWLGAVEHKSFQEQRETVVPSKIFELLDLLGLDIENGQIVLDDVLPEQMEMVERTRRFNAWCGDVYKIVPILRKVN